MTPKFYRKYAGIFCLAALSLIALGIAPGSASGAATAIPYLVGVSPTSAPIGGSGFTLTVNGANFTSASTVEWNLNGVATPLATTFVGVDQLTATVPASLVVSYGTASITVSTLGVRVPSNVAYLTVTNPSTLLTWRLTQQSPSGGNHPYFPVTGVFNTQVSNSPLDLAVTNDTSGVDTPPGVSVFVGNGNGSFQGAGAASTYPVGSNPQGLVIGDFNGDGIPDLASVDNQGTLQIPDISVLLGNGDGTFQAPITAPLATNSRPILAVAADFNGDGKLDLIVACEGTALSGVGNVTFLQGNGDGTFQAPQSYFLGASSLPTQPSGLAVADFDGNGTLDLAVTDNLSGEIWILSGVGDGTFASPGTEYATAAAPDGLVTADFNGDGSPDLAVAYQNTPEVSVLLNSAGAFPAHVEYPTSAGGLFLAAADLNGDGILDLAVPGYASDLVSILLGNGSGGIGDGTFGTSAAYTVGVAFTSILGITAGDFNSDGRLDLAFTVGTALNTTNDIAVLVQAPLWTASPTALTFGNQAVGTQSASQTVTFTNTGAAPLQLTAISSTDGTHFPETNTCGRLPATFPPGAGCTVTVTFNPSVPGSIKADISVMDNITAPGMPQLVPLSGTGTQPAVGFNPTSLTFGNQPVGVKSSARTVTLTNTGNGTMSIAGIAASGDFGETNTCGSSLNAGANCIISVTFTPTATGTRTGSLSVTDNAPGSPQTVSLTGTGTGPAVSLNPTSLVFAGQMANTTSASQAVTLTNTGNGSLTITNIAASGNFAQTNNCGSTVAASASCTITATFTPTTGGALTGAVTITDNAAGSPQTIGLSGTGLVLAATASPTKLTFSGQLVGSSSASQNVTLTNTGTVGLNITSLAATGDFTETNTCGTSLAASAACTISVIFKPSVTGTRSGTLTVSDTNNSGSGSASGTETVSLTGTGTAPAASLSTIPAFAGQLLGTTSSVQTVTVSNTGTGPLTVSSVAVSGTNASDFAESNTCLKAAVAAGGTCSISVTFTPATGGSLSGTLTVTDNATPTTQAVSLTGTGSVLAATATPGSLTFSGQLLSTGSATQNVTLSNTGTVGLNITSLAATGDFTETNTCGTSLAASATCTISVTFKPSATGTRTGTLTIADTNNSGLGSASSTETVSLTGTGTAPVGSLSTPTAFAGQLVGSTSAAQIVTVSNTGTAPLTVTNVAISGADAGDFAATNTCSAAVAVGGNCTISVTFKPLATGSLAGTLSVTDNNNGIAGSAQSVSLTGTGTAPGVTLSPASLSFGNQNVGTSSAAQNVTMTNNGTATLALTSIVASGDFSQTSACGNSLAAGASCTVAVTFKPSAVFSRSGTLTVTNDASTGTQSVTLTGTGVGAQATLSASSLTFSGALIGVTSAAKALTLTNSGNSSMTISGMAASGDFAQSSTCAGTLAPAASCTISVTSKASVIGTNSGAFTLTSNSVGSPQTVALSGTGQDFTLIGSAPATITPGQTATYTVTLTPEDGLNQTIALACSGAPSDSACSVSSSSVTPTGPTSLKVTVTTTAASAVVPLSRPVPPLSGSIRWLLLSLIALAGMMMMARRNGSAIRLRPVLVSIAMLVVLALGTTACGGGTSGSSGTSTPGTPAGTYSITVTGTATSGSVTVTHNAVLTLGVQ